MENAGRRKRCQWKMQGGGEAVPEACSACLNWPSVMTLLHTVSRRGSARTLPLACRLCPSWPASDTAASSCAAGNCSTVACHFDCSSSRQAARTLDSLC